MDGLSGAASGMAVVSLALQLGGSIKQLYDFWGSVKEAPDDIRAITTDLSLLSSVLAEMAFEEQHSGPDPMLTTVLEACCERVNKLAQLTNDMEPDFASMSLRIRKWTAFKAILKGERIQKFQKVLEGLKTTLVLAQQNHHSRLNRIRYQSQQQNLTTITKHLSNLKLEQMSATITTVSNSSSVVDDHTNALRGEVSRIRRTVQNPVQRVSFGMGSDRTVQDLACNLSRDQSTTSGPLASPEVDRSGLSYIDETLRRSRQQRWTNDTLSFGNSITQTLFGTITTTTRTRLLESNFVDDDTLNDEEYQYERESSFRILPARWLLKLGFNCAYNFSTHDSSTQGWQWCLKPINLIPDDASIFEFCTQGNIEKVRDLITRNLASVRDIDSNGRTALHSAARSHSPDLCKFLIEAGADKTVQTFWPWSRESPLREVSWRPITKDGLVNAIDTCRVFEDSFDFWDEDGDGWGVLGSVSRYNRDLSTAEAKATLTFLLWLIQSSSPDIKANYNTDMVFYLILQAHPTTADAVGSLLELGPPGAIDKLTPITETFPEEPIFFYLIASERWDHVKMLLALGANPHLVCFSYALSSQAESPLSLAMYSSWTFWYFRDALRGINLDVEDIVGQELKQGCPLLDAGWQMETLSALLELDFEPDVEPPKPYMYISCDCCCSTLLHDKVQPYWLVMLESIKNGIYPQTFDLDTQAEQSSSSQGHLATSNQDSLTSTADGSALSHDPTLPEDQVAQSAEESSTSDSAATIITPGRKEVWRISCWNHFKETGRRYSHAITETHSSDGDDSSDDDFSPFLFNT